MAIYYCDVKIIGRSSGRSSVAAAAYRSGEKLHNERDGITHDYSRRSDVVHTEIMLPENAPTEYQGRSTLWNTVEQSEKRRDSQTAREVVFALPVEFSLQEQIELVKEYVQGNFVDNGMCADIAIHDKGDGAVARNQIKDLGVPCMGAVDQSRALDSTANPHAHIMLTTREVSQSGFGGKNRDWNRVEQLEAWRENWAAACNERFQDKGIDARIDHRTLEEQGIDREPTIHEGRNPERIKENAEIKERNEMFAPAAVAEYMNELQDAFTIVDEHLRDSAENRREADGLTYRAEDMTERAAEIEQKRKLLADAQAERDSMGFWQNKKAMEEKINQLTIAERHSRDYFERTFKVGFEAASAEIERLKAQAGSIIQEFHDTESFREYRNIITLEYQKHRLLAEVRPDGREILSRIKTPPDKLGRISEDNFRSIIKEVRPTQAQILTDRRKEVMFRRKSYERTR